MKAKAILFLVLAPILHAQAVVGIMSGSPNPPQNLFSPTVTVTPTQAVLSYNPAPCGGNCTVQIADMNRQIAVSSASQSAGTVTVTTAAAHGLKTGQVVYLENTGVNAWNGWQTLTGGSGSTFTFASSTSGTASTGNVGVLVDDVNPSLFSGSNSDARSSTTNYGGKRQFVAGLRTGQLAIDNLKHSRALQAASRHVYTITGTGGSVTGSFTSFNPQQGDTFNYGYPADLTTPGQYAYPTVDFGNQGQYLIGPLDGYGGRRISGPADAGSSTTNFVTALDLTGGGTWTVNAGFPTSSTAVYNGTCGSPPCPLFLRADNFQLATTYTTAGPSLDWVQPTITASAASGSPTMNACLTVNGTTCSGGTKTSAALTSTPTPITLGTTNVIDLWQTSGGPPFSSVDASERTGTATYNASTHVLTWASGNLFNVAWNTGACITFNSAQYRIASLQSEVQVTLDSSIPNVCGSTALPSSTTAAFSANNFGVLVWSSGAAITISSVSYQFGSANSANMGDSAGSVCALPTTVLSGITYRDCFFGNEEVLVGTDSSGNPSYIDLGEPHYGNYSPYFYNAMVPILSTGITTDPTQFGVYYTLVNAFNISNSTWVINKIHRSQSSYTAVPFGTVIQDCVVTSGVQPCTSWEAITPTPSNTVDQLIPAFNSAWVSSGFQSVFNSNPGAGAEMFLQGSSYPGDPYDAIVFYAYEHNQDSRGWEMALQLNGRNPAGSGSGAVAISAATSITDSARPDGYCSMHFAYPPMAGFAGWISNDLFYETNTSFPYSSAYGFKATLSSPSTLPTSGFSSCASLAPSNPFGVTSNSCITITTSTVPTNNASATKAWQVGDVLAGLNDYSFHGGERMRVLQTSPSIVLQMGYNTSATSTDSVLIEACGLPNVNTSMTGVWDFVNDPMGTNSAWTTVVNDSTTQNTHQFSILGLNIGAGGGTVPYYIRTGNLKTYQTNPTQTMQASPQFNGMDGLNSNEGGSYIESHPYCQYGAGSSNGQCFDSRPLLGATGGSFIIGSSGSQYTFVSGQLWKFAGGASALHRKTFNTLAYSGNHILLDVSGPGSTIGNTSSDSWKYCIALAANECVNPSSAGDVFVNVPYVRFPYPFSDGTANQSGDTTGIFIGDLGPTSGLWQQMTPGSDTTGASQRWGNNFSRWNLNNVFANVSSIPSLNLAISWPWWLGGARSDLFGTNLPAVPASDGEDRTGFIAVPITVTPPTGMSIDHVAIEYGEAENGNQFYCRSRQDTCEAVSAAGDTTNPFYWPAETYTRLAATGGTPVTITLEIRAGETPYFRWKGYSGGSLVWTDSTQVVSVH